MKILLIEDNKALADTVHDLLTVFYRLDISPDATQGLQQAQHQKYDLIIMDIALPDGDGIALCRELRTQGSTTPVLMLTAQHSVEQKVMALNAGADDYVTKPFNSQELLARIRALLRRPATVLAGNVITVGKLVIDVLRYQVKWGKKEITLRRKEFSLLEYLARHKGQVVTRHMILDHVWDSDSDNFSNTVDVHINYLREKIDRPFRTQLIKTIPGIGYKLEGGDIRERVNKENSKQ